MEKMTMWFTKMTMAVARRRECGQGTSEYAILIGVISILAVVGVLAFGDELASLLDAANSRMAQVNAWSH